MLNETQLKVFVDHATHYFSAFAQEPAIVRVPYLISHDESLVYDYTGVIGVSGAFRGCVYFTAPARMMQYLLMTQGETEHSQEHCLDVVGEIATTLAGNARRELGSDFMISVPIRIAGKPEQLTLARSARSYAIPIQWRVYSAALVVSLEDG
ncbi:MAG TPA: chemotaxis protein CheX [Plasticicumulans sp.]|nr:chemotaxis protein CheX [Plasticicumulans sp.]